jgi:hypothetical protein
VSSSVASVAGGASTSYGFYPSLYTTNGSHFCDRSAEWPSGQQDQPSDAEATKQRLDNAAK